MKKTFEEKEPGATSGKRTMPRIWFWLMLFLLILILGFLWQFKIYQKVQSEFAEFDKKEGISIFFDVKSSMETLKLQFEGEMIEMESSLRQMGLDVLETALRGIMEAVSAISQKIFEVLEKTFQGLKNKLLNLQI